MTTFVDKVLKRIGLLSCTVGATNVPSASIDLNSEHIDELKNIPRYPPYMEGLPVYSSQELLSTQKELIRRIKQIIANDELLKAHYYPSMQRLASFVQLLPASQSHHHRGAGGLLRHSIEVALWSLQQTEGKLIRNVITPQQRRLIEPRWRLAVFYAGLCHDLGKVVTDLSITDRSKEHTWEPYSEGIFDWAMSHNIKNYFLHWKEGRGKNHTHVSSTLLDVVVSKQSLRWMSHGDTDIVIWLTEAINNNPGATNQIHDFVVRADQLSVERDLKSMGVAMAGYEIGVPIERYLTDIMRRLVREGVWRINEPGARIWNIGNTTYLVWPMAGEEVARCIRDENIPGLPKTPDGILDMMVERHLAFLREGENDPYFYIAPQILTEKIPDIKMRCIRLRDQALISTMPIASVEGRVIQQKKNEPNDSEATKEAAAAPIDPVVPVKIGVNDKTTAVPHQNAAAQSELPLEQPQNTESNLNEVSEPIAEQPQRASECTENVASKNHPLPQSDHRTPTEDADLKLESLTGFIGELIRVLLADLASGKKDCAMLLTRPTTRQVCCRWPDTFAGYGFTPKQILDGLTEQGWMEAASEVAKVGDFEFANGKAKGIKLTERISKLFPVAPPVTVSRTPTTPAVPISEVAQEVNSASTPKKAKPNRKPKETAVVIQSTQKEHTVNNPQEEKTAPDNQQDVGFLVIQKVA